MVEGVGFHLNQRLKIKMDGVTGTFSEVHSVTAQSASSKGQTGAPTLKPSALTDRLQPANQNCRMQNWTEIDMKPPQSTNSDFKMF